MELINLGDVAKQSKHSKQVILKLAEDYGFEAVKIGRLWHVDANIRPWLEKYDRAYTKTEWRRRGRQIRENEARFATQYFYRIGYVNLYIEEQTEPKAATKAKPKAKAA